MAAAKGRALVIGGSVGGLFAANLLRGAGWDVAVFEKTAGDLASRGAGLGLSGELFAVMRRVGAALSPSTGVAVSSLLWLGSDGSVVRELPRPWLTGAWSRIYRPLRATIPDAVIRSGRTLDRVEESADGVTAIFTDGQRESADLLIAADGVYSTVRRQFLPEIEPRYAGYVAWRGMVEESELAPAAHRQLSNSISFAFPPHEMLLATPIPGRADTVAKGERRYYYIWYRPVAEGPALRDMLTDASGRHHGIAIPPPLIRAELIAAMKDDARRLLPPAIADVVTRTKEPLLQAITDLEVPRLVFGRTALIGDAAFIARPHVAAGITKAALDTVSLVEALEAESDIDSALARFERERRAFGSSLVAYSRYLGEASLAPEPQRDPDRVMREYGAPHLLADAQATAIG